MKTYTRPSWRQIDRLGPRGHRPPSRTDTCHSLRSSGNDATVIDNVVALLLLHFCPARFVVNKTLNLVWPLSLSFLVTGVKAIAQ